MIYCVEDDKDIMQIMLYTLKSAGFEAVGFENGADFWKAVEKRVPDLVMLDIMLPGEDGLSILSKLRAKQETKDVYVIMTTAKGSEYDKVVGLDGGADFYLAKPFGMLEMVAHVKAVFRRGSKIVDREIISLGKIKINVTQHKVYAGEEEIFLTNKEYEILKILISNPGKVLSREEMLGKIWGYDWAGESRTIDVHIGALRTKMGEYGDYIETIRGLGYKAEDRG